MDMDEALPAGGAPVLVDVFLLDVHAVAASPTVTTATPSRKPTRDRAI
jgi:hypothetical protein